jgi:hypothetical protein
MSAQIHIEEVLLGFPVGQGSRDGSEPMADFRNILRSFVEVFAGAPATVIGGGPRAAGPPRSPNGASSFHLTWQMPSSARVAGLVEVSAVLEVVEPPQVSSLYFWALQVDMEDDGLVWGGGHTGLQWNSRFPGGTAANWGGYASQQRGGGVLSGSHPELFSFPGDPNTMAFPWIPQHPYRLRVHRSPDTAAAWRASLTDVATGDVVVLRDLMQPEGLKQRSGRAQGTGHLVRPLVWSEVFADCDAPSVTVRWSDFSATREDGVVVRPEALTVNYQSREAGGCANTSVRRDGTGVLQITNTPRDVPQGSRLDLMPQMLSG